MKRFLVLWLLMASCLSGLAAGQALCKNKNQMLDKIAHAGGKIYMFPRENHGFCQHEWPSFGTCCEPVSADAVMKAKIQRNLHDVQEMIQEIEHLPGAIQSFHLTAIKSQAMSHAAKWSCQHKYDALVAHLNWQRTGFRSSQYRCMNRLNQLTRASTCTICSGRSQEFFQGEKLVVQESVCRSILGDCGQAWRGVFNVLTFLKVYLNEIKQHYKGSLPKEHFDSLEALSRSHNLSEHFKRCPKISECDTNTVADICQHMVSILTPSYADSMGLKLKETRRLLTGKLLLFIGNLLRNAGKAVVNNLKKVFKGRVRQSPKAYVPFGNTVTTQGHELAWALSSGDHSNSQLDLEAGRVLQHSKNEGCDTTIIFACDTDILVGRTGATTTGFYERGP